MIHKQVIAVILLLSITTVARGQDAYNQLRRLIQLQPQQQHQEVISEGSSYVKLHTPQSEVEDALLFLHKLPPHEAQFIRFFSTYAVQPEERENTALTLSFVVHSLIGRTTRKDGNFGTYYPLATKEDGKFIPHRKVPGSDTLWWIDLRDYNWTAQAWEDISVGDAYFAEPIVTHDRSGALRLIAGNAIVRADWFIKQSVTSTDQSDVGKDDFYTTLLYAEIDEPNNIDQWRRIWGLDLKRAREFGNEYSTLVTKSKAVTRHNRMLFGYRTDFGYLYETYDVLFEQGKRDYLESFLLNRNPGEPPEVSDAGEAFASNAVGLQVYALRDANNNLVDFGDPTAVRHINDVIGDVRVRYAFSCIDCHASGPLPSENTLVEFVKAYGNIKTLDKDDSLRIRRSTLSGKFKESIENNQKFFASSLKKTNGLSPGENGELFLKAISRYYNPVDLKQAAFECGVTQEEFISAVKKDVRFGARLKLLVQTGEPIPREVWDSPGVDGIPGAFQQAMILLHGLTIIEDEFAQQKEKVIVVDEDDVINHGEINRDIILDKNGRQFKFDVDNQIQQLRDITGPKFRQLRVINTYRVSKDWKNLPVRAGRRVLTILPSKAPLLPTGKIINNGKDWLEVYTTDGHFGYVELRYLELFPLDEEQVFEIFDGVPVNTINGIIR